MLKCAILFLVGINMYIAWQSMIIEGIVFIAIGILAAIILRFYNKKHNALSNKNAKDSKD